jgi:hypothetical protein
MPSTRTMHPEEVVGLSGVIKKVDDEGLEFLSETGDRIIFQWPSVPDSDPHKPDERMLEIYLKEEL